VATGGNDELRDEKRGRTKSGHENKTENEAAAGSEMAKTRGN